MASRHASPSKLVAAAASGTAAAAGSGTSTAAKVGSPSAYSPLLASGLAPRPFTHAPYITTGNIIASDELEAAERSAYAGGGDHRRSAPGSPVLTGSFNASHNSANAMHGAQGFSGGKKNVCRHFLNGNCNRGSSCRFYHPGSIHRVVTPTHPRTPTQRPLTPLADLAQQNSSSGFANASPVQSPHTDAVATFSAPFPLRPTLPAPVMGGSGSRSSGGVDGFSSPLGSPATSAQRGTSFTDGAAPAPSTTPALTSPSSGPKFSPGTSLAARARRVPELNPLPALQLPDCMQGGGSDDGAHDGVTASGERAAAVPVPPSPASPGPYRMPVYRSTARPIAVSLSGRTESADGLAGPHDSQSPPHFSSTLAAAAEGATSPSAGSTTRNNPYAYSPTGVTRQPGQPMSPLKRTPNTH